MAERPAPEPSAPPGRPRYQLLLEPIGPGPHDPDEVGRRLRAAVKKILRKYGFRNLGLGPVADK